MRVGRGVTDRQTAITTAAPHARGEKGFSYFILDKTYFIM